MGKQEEQAQREAAMRKQVAAIEQTKNAATREQMRRLARGGK